MCRRRGCGETGTFARRRRERDAEQPRRGAPRQLKGLNAAPHTIQQFHSQAGAQEKGKCTSHAENVQTNVYSGINRGSPKAKQLNGHQLTNKSKKRSLSIHMMEYYSTIKKRNDSCYNMNKPRRYAKTNRPVAKGRILYGSISTKCPEQGTLRRWKVD